jgi:hypothetical protein
MFFLKGFLNNQAELNKLRHIFFQYTKAILSLYTEETQEDNQ